jgi:hypothetical protein
MDWVHGPCTTPGSGPPWTGDHCHTQSSTGAWPPAAPGLKVTGEGAGEVEEAAASMFVGSLELRRW